MRIYLAGPMSFRADTDWNYPAFNEAATRLRARGYMILNPAESDGGTTDKPREFYMRKAIELLMQADTVAALEGWGNSKGAMLEIAIARELGLPVIDAKSLRNVEYLI